MIGAAAVEALDEGRPVEGERDRAADERRVERRPVDAEVERAVGAGRLPLHPHLGVVEQRLRALVARLERHVRLARLQREDDRRVVGVVAQRHLLEVGKAAAPVACVADVPRLLVRHVLAQDERAGPDPALGERPRLVRRAAGSRRCTCSSRRDTGSRRTACRGGSGPGSCPSSRHRRARGLRREPRAPRSRASGRRSPGRWRRRRPR